MKKTNATREKDKRHSPSCPAMTPPLPASSSVVAKPFSSFCRATGGGVGGKEAGGVGGLLRLFCCKRDTNVNNPPDKIGAAMATAALEYLVNQLGVIV